MHEILKDFYRMVNYEFFFKDYLKFKKRKNLGLTIFFMSTSTSLFTGGTFYSNLNNFDEYLAQHSLKSGGTNDH
jgi:hypothetical protein